MTIVHESYTNDEGFYANIQRHKFEKAFEMCIIQVFEGCEIGHTVYSHYYMTIPDARRAMRRQFKNNIGGTLRKTYDIKKDGL